MAGGAPPLTLGEQTMTSLRFWICLVVCCAPALGRGAGLHLERIRLPPGFAIDVYAQGVKNATFLVEC